MTRFVEIAREGGVKLLCDRETLKEYPLTLKTAINIANTLNEEILAFENCLIRFGESFETQCKNQERFIFGDVSLTSFKTIVEVMEWESKSHKLSNNKMYKEFGAFDEFGKFKYHKDVPVDLLKKIQHTLISLEGLRATDYNCPATGYVSLRVDDLIELDFTELIKEIDGVLE